jgi:hypothetical protein
MKRITITFLCFLLALAARAQSNPVDELFNKYSEKEGFTTVYISSKMFGMFKNQETEDKELNDMMARLKSIRILAVEDTSLNKSINFYSELSKKLDFSVYEELMVVKEGNDVTKFLIKQNGNFIAELLVITGGRGGNTLISIRGDLDLKSISGLSKSIGIEQLGSLENIDKKPIKK